MKPLLSYAEVRAPKKPKDRKGVKQYNAKRKGHRFPKCVNQPLREFTPTLPCILEGRVDRAGVRHRCRTQTMCCHRIPQSHGVPDENDTFSACWDAHREQEGNTKEFEYQWQVRLKVVCRQTTTAFWRAYPELRKRKVADG